MESIGGLNFGFALEFADECFGEWADVWLLFGIGYEWIAVEIDGE
jgi:hypothetical protein